MKIVFKYIVLFFCLWLAGFCYFVANLTSDDIDLRKTDAIIVLTGGKGRVAEAVDLLSKNMADKMLITGVAKTTNIEEMIFLSPELSSNVVLPLKDKITLGKYATNTTENAKEASAWMEENNFKSLRLVTSDYHMPRSMLEFKLLMPDKLIIPHPFFNNNIQIKNWWNYPTSILLLLSEYHKYIIVKFIDKR
jgi:uncharacterized SAM-binding protein YcdF (DUF218 family)